ncbi:MAG: nucleotidyl transferase AbiEii/AbiGii toxin family protein [Jiangellaceae bacterium]
MALEQRLLTRSNERASASIGCAGASFERIVARLEAAEPGRWVLKGGMALEVRLRDDARLTKDIDLGLREDVAGAADLHERLIDALTADLDGDGFELAPGSPAPLREDGGGHLTLRLKVAAGLAGRPFGAIQLDVSPRAYELDATDVVTLPNMLDIAGVPAPLVEIVQIHRHSAEKLHAMLRDFGDRQNSRVRDLVDPAAVAAATRQVWAERDGVGPPRSRHSPSPGPTVTNGSPTTTCTRSRSPPHWPS